jgi:hypothetical protein
MGPAALHGLMGELEQAEIDKKVQQYIEANPDEVDLDRVRAMVSPGAIATRILYPVTASARPLKKQELPPATFFRRAVRHTDLAFILAHLDDGDKWTSMGVKIGRQRIIPREARRKEDDVNRRIIPAVVWAEMDFLAEGCRRSFSHAFVRQFQGATQNKQELRLPDPRLGYPFMELYLGSDVSLSLQSRSCPQVTVGVSSGHAILYDASEYTPDAKDTCARVFSFRKAVTKDDQCFTVITFAFYHNPQHHQ